MALKLVSSTPVNPSNVKSYVDVTDLSDPTENASMHNFMHNASAEIDEDESLELDDSDLLDGIDDEDLDEDNLDASMLSDAEASLYTLAVVYSELFPQPSPEQLQALAVALSIPADALVSLLESTTEISSEELDVTADADLESEDIDISDELDGLGEDDEEDFGNEGDDLGLDDGDADDNGLDDSLDLTDDDLVELDDMLDDPSETAATDGITDPVSDETDEMKIAFNNDGMQRNKPNPDDVALMHDGEPEPTKPAPRPFAADDGAPSL